jgi:hypothetical protein
MAVASPLDAVSSFECKVETGMIQLIKVVFGGRNTDRTCERYHVKEDQL